MTNHKQEHSHHIHPKVLI